MMHLILEVDPGVKPTSLIGKPFMLKLNDEQRTRVKYGRTKTHENIGTVVSAHPQRRTVDVEVPNNIAPHVRLLMGIEEPRKRDGKA